MKLSKSTRLNQALLVLNIITPRDAVLRLPYRYEDFSLTAETNLYHGQRLVVYGKATSAATVNVTSRYKIVNFRFLSQSGKSYQVVAFNRPYLLKVVTLGSDYTLIGTFDRKNNGINLLTLRAGAIKEEDRYKPIYSLPSGIDQHVYQRLVLRVFPLAEPDLGETIPPHLIAKYHLQSKVVSLKLIHQPTTSEDIRQGYRTIKYEEALRFCLKTQLIRQQNRFLYKIKKPDIDLSKINDFVKTLPYKLSQDQLSAVREIILDMNKETLMYRLLQGDVGSGKTVVAALALYANYLRRDQGAIMAPTDALAKQHFLTLKQLFKPTGVQVALLVGGMSGKEKQSVKDGLLDGVVDVVVGTHALFSDDVVYQSLGLAVIDEQHRFGVNQRSLLSNKGSRADLLLMSATPIPRTLALTVYGDMDQTSIRHFPKARRTVKTMICEPGDRRIDEALQASLAKGRRIFVIAPTIEESEYSAQGVEVLYDEYAKRYHDQVGLLHGRLASEEKDAVMRDFVAGRVPILVATTVIEVGIDVPTADVMIVYAAERFGLASLHQLRGRIGRDGQPASFLLVTDIESPEEHARMKVLVDTDDGFRIAEEDLSYRGPGELSGRRQAGFGSFVYINPYEDYKMLSYARNDAIDLLEHPCDCAQALIEEIHKQIKDAPYG
jgi:ATP-dependent DNA helicase RecG